MKKYRIRQAKNQRILIPAFGTLIHVFLLLIQFWTALWHLQINDSVDRVDREAESLNPLTHGRFSDPYFKFLGERVHPHQKVLQGQEFSGMGCVMIF